MRLPLTPGVTLMLKLASGVRLEVKLTPCVTLMWKLASGVRFGSICVVLAYFQAVVMLKLAWCTVRFGSI